MTYNLILKTDSYKASHFNQYAPGTKFVNSYIEARGKSGDFPMHHNEVVFFGLQAFLKEWLTRPIFRSDITQAERILTAHGEPFNRDGWEYILEKHNGYIPVEIEALPEGTPVPFGVPMVQVRNTDPRVPWVTSYIETMLLRAVWYPSTVATISREAKMIIYGYLHQTCEDPAGQIPFKLHDFGARGVSSGESAALGGLAHLVNFMGTDTVEALVAAQMYYDSEMAGFSIPAAEHSTITSWGMEGEVDAYRNMIKQFGKPGALVAVVSDSYNIYNAVENIWGGVLKDTVLESGATVVVRPDSGNPPDVVSKVLEVLGEKFGYTVNRLGYKVLHPSVRVIQSDGINLVSLREILKRICDEGWSAENVAFGMGGGLLQHVNRDTFKFAMKASAISKKDKGDVWIPISKEPVTDPGKASKAGIVGVYKDYQGILRGYCGRVLGQEDGMLERVYYNGNLTRDMSLEVVRRNAAI